MTLEKFIDENRAELNQAINGALYRHDGRGVRGTIPDPAPVHSDDEIEEWINNDEGLYNWARSEGALEEYEIEDEEELRAAFWEAHPDLTEVPGQRQNSYPCDTRCAFVDYVDMMQKDGSISEELASTVTL